MSMSSVVQGDLALGSFGAFFGGTPFSLFRNATLWNEKSQKGFKWENGLIIFGLLRNHLG